MYKRVTKDYYVIQGFYSSFYGWEDLEGYEDYQEAKRCLKYYNDNERYPHRIKKMRLHIDNKES